MPLRFDEIFEPEPDTGVDTVKPCDGVWVIRESTGVCVRIAIPSYAYASSDPATDEKLQ